MLFDSQVVQSTHFEVTTWMGYRRGGPHGKMSVLPTHVEARVTWLHRVMCNFKSLICALCVPRPFFPAL